MKTAILVLLSISTSVLFLFMVLTIVYRKNGTRRRPPSFGSPFVSLLKPIKNVDDDMERNLESFFALDYPAYEILFAVDSLRDPCVAILKRLRRKYPAIPTAIIATGHPPTGNPKIHKLARLEAESRGDLFWVTDSNIRVEKDTLARLVDEHLAKDAKIVFSLIRGTSSRTFGSLMENSSLNIFTSGSIITAWKFARQHILVGKSILIERKALSTFGGFAYFKNFLAEDFLLGESFVKSRFRISTNYIWVTNVNQTGTITSFFKRMSRWAKLRFHLKKPVYVIEFLANPIVLTLFALPVLGDDRFQILATVALSKLFIEYLNFLAVNTEDRKRLRFHLLFPASVLVKELVLLAVYVTPFLSRDVEWRGGTITIGRKTLISEPTNLDNLVHEGA